MSHFVVGNDPALIEAEQPVLLLEPGDNALDRRRKIGGNDGLGIAASCKQRGFVDQCVEIRTGKAGGHCRHLFRRDIGAGPDFLEIDVEDLNAPGLIGAIDQHLAIKTAGAQQGRIEDLRPVGRREQYQADRRVETVDLGKELIEGLYLFFIAADLGGGAASKSKGVELVNKDNRGRHLPALLKQITHPCGADADIELDKIPSR